MPITNRHRCTHTRVELARYLAVLAMSSPPDVDVAIASLREEKRAEFEQVEEAIREGKYKLYEDETIETVIERLKTAANKEFEQEVVELRARMQQELEAAIEKVRASIPDELNSPQCHFPSGHAGGTNCLFDDTPPDKNQWDCGECAYRNHVMNTTCMTCGTARTNS